MRQVTLFFCVYVAAALGSSLDLQGVRDNEAEEWTTLFAQPWADVRRDLHKSSFICTQTHFPHLNGNWWMSLWFCHCQPATRGWRCQFVVRCECSWFWRQPRDGVFSFNFLNSYVCLTYIYVYWKVIYELKLIKSWFPVPYGPNPWIVDKGVDVISAPYVSIRITTKWPVCCLLQLKMLF